MIEFIEGELNFRKLDTNVIKPKIGDHHFQYVN